MCPRFAIRKGAKVLSRLDIMTPSRAQTVIDGLYRDVERRIAASPPGLCPVDLAMNFLNLCHAQTCGKCVPCRVGLGQLSDLMESVLDGKATMETIALIERTARVIVNSADCAIGRDAARLVLDGVQGFRDDYEEHILRHRCLGGMREPVPCVALCPAGVDIPGYLVLIKYGRYADAVRLIRKDNPFPSACAYICEHPCEARCRRNMIDDAVNIRGLKRYAVDNAGYVPQPDCAEPTGKKVAVIGGGVGCAIAYPVAKKFHENGAAVHSVVGFRTKDLVILENEFRAVSDEYRLMSDDGSAGEKGLVTDALRALIESGEKYDEVIAIGPLVMMKFVCLLTKELNIPTVVSMNPIMVDGTGMCGACRLMVGNEVKFACVDGPEFDGHLVDFDLAMKRQQMYKTEEGRALLRYQEGATHHGGCGQCGGDK